MKTNEKGIILDSSKYFTLSSLADYLNEIFKEKKSGKKFNPQDIQHYIRRGHLPVYLGGNEIKDVEKLRVGVKLYKIVGELNISF